MKKLSALLVGILLLSGCGGGEKVDGGMQKMSMDEFVEMVESDLKGTCK